MTKIFLFITILSACSGGILESWIALYPPRIEGLVYKKYMRIEAGRPEYHVVVRSGDKSFDVTPISREDFEVVAVYDSLFKGDSSLHLFFYRSDSLVLMLNWNSHKLSNYFGKRYYGE